MANILVVYCYGEYPLRTSIEDHLYAFERYSEHKCYYLNLLFREVPWYITQVHFDLAIFHTVFLSQRWSHAEFRRIMQRASPLKRLDAVKIAIPQDEFINTDILCDFINEFDIGCVFSVAPESEWPKIYASIDRERVKLFEVLTGYLDDSTIERVNKVARLSPERSIDVGYRAWRAEPWLGRHGMLKTQLATLFQERAPQIGLNADISTRAEDTLLGDEWYKFLLKCKYTIGVEGGASILDRDGTIRERTNEYTARHPDASFDEIEAQCFPGVDGSLSLFAISPRHLEACVTRTCQVLVEGCYYGILVAGKHYIQLSKNFANIDQVLNTLKRDDLRDEIAERAYNDVVASGRYSYRSFVSFVTGKSLQGYRRASTPSLRRIREWLVWRWMRLADSVAWGQIALRKKIKQVLETLLPRGAMVFVMRKIREYRA